MVSMLFNECSNNNNFCGSNNQLLKEFQHLAASAKVTNNHNNNNFISRINRRQENKKNSIYRYIVTRREQHRLASSFSSSISTINNNNNNSTNNNNNNNLTNINYSSPAFSLTGVRDFTSYVQAKRRFTPTEKRYSIAVAAVAAVAQAAASAAILNSNNTNKTNPSVVTSSNFNLTTQTNNNDNALSSETSIDDPNFIAGDSNPASPSPSNSSILSNICEDSTSPKNTNTKKQSNSVFLQASCFCKGKNSNNFCSEPNNQNFCGEDAFFIAQNQKAIGVADGVGGWSLLGINAAEFSWSLMNKSKTLAEQKNLNSAIDLMTTSYEQIVSEGIVKAGSATSCIVVVEDIDESTLNNNQQQKSQQIKSSIWGFENMNNKQSNKPIGKLNYANIGDSGFLIIRNGRIIYRTMEQQHTFNAPKQLGVIPDHMKEGAFNDQPSDADVGDGKQILVEEGDVLILGTDGLFDNVFDEEIVEVVQNNITSTDPNVENNIAYDLVSLANKHAHDATRNGPFAVNALMNRLFFVGGKVDDVTSLCAIVKSKKD